MTLEAWIKCSDNRGQTSSEIHFSRFVSPQRVSSPQNTSVGRNFGLINNKLPKINCIVLISVYFGEMDSADGIFYPVCRLLRSALVYFTQR